MEELSKLKCTACRGGVEPMGPEEVARYRALLDPEWEVIEGRKLRRRYRFKNFRAALDQANAIGELAEREGHHPDLSLGWGRLEVELFTHKIGGLHLNDFILASMIDRLTSVPAASGN